MITQAKGHILVVDDNQVNRLKLSRVLKQQAYDVTLTKNGRQAITLLRDRVSARRQNFDLVFLDILMPEMDGFAVLEQMKRDSALRDIPVIVISAVDEMKDMARCIEMGADDYVVKPFDRILLEARVSACLDKKRLRDQEQLLIQELAAMENISRMLNATLDLKKAMELSLKWVERQSPQYSYYCDIGFMGLVDKQETIQIVETIGNKQLIEVYNEKISIEQFPVIKQAISKHKIQCVSIPDVATEAFLSPNGKSQIVAPIIRQRQLIGIIVLENTHSTIIQPKWVRLLTSFTDYAAIAIANAQLYKKVEEANLAKSEFITMVSHELRAPMTAIKGFADVLLSETPGSINDTQKNFLNMIDYNVKRMNVLVHDLADISRIETGHLHMTLEPLAVANTVSEVLGSLENQLKERSHIVTTQVPTSLPRVFADRTRFIQILTNLITNACKYTPPNGKIEIAAEQVIKQNKSMIQVLIRDNGIGLKSEDQKNVFQKFFRSSDAPARRQPGTGLGLNIARELVELHGGQLWFTSEYGKGSVFYFTLPTDS